MTPEFPLTTTRFNFLFGSSLCLIRPNGLRSVHDELQLLHHILVRKFVHIVLRCEATLRRDADPAQVHFYLQQGRNDVRKTTYWFNASSFDLGSTPCAINSAALFTLVFNSSGSSSVEILVETKPRTTSLCFGRCLSGSNVPARSVSYSSYVMSCVSIDNPRDEDDGDRRSSSRH